MKISNLVLGSSHNLFYSCRVKQIYFTLRAEKINEMKLVTLVTSCDASR